jgi:outer membrane lipoprotein-sorting protein
MEGFQVSGGSDHAPRITAEFNYRQIGYFVRIMRKYPFLILVLILAISTFSNAITPEEVMKRIDQEMYLPSAQYAVTMQIVYDPDDIRTSDMEVYTQGTDTARIIVKSPPRDKDMEFLRRGKSLWIYFPRNMRTLLIQGHRLREGMLGSDFSYEDMTESSTLLEDYSAEFLPQSNVGELQLLLTAKVPDVTYYQRRVTVDTTHWVPTHVELISKSGKILKDMVLDQVTKVKGHWLPYRTTMRDLLRQNTSTTMTITSMKIGITFPEDFFSRRALGSE